MFYVTVMTGLIARRTFDPAGAPEAQQLAEGLRRAGVKGGTEGS